MTLNIAYVWDRLLPTTGTDAEQALHTLSALARRGHRIQVCVPESHRTKVTSESLRQHYNLVGDFDVHTEEFPFSEWLPLRKAFHPLRVSRSSVLRDVDLVYTRNLATFLWLSERGFPTLYDTHRAWPDRVPWLRPLIADAMSRPNFVGALFHSQYARRSYVSLSIPLERLEVAHNGYDPARYLGRVSPREARERLGLSLEQPLVVYTGHMTPFKGLGAVCRLAERCPDLTLVMVGLRPGSTSDHALRRLPNVRVESWQPFENVALYQYAADVLLIPPTSLPLEWAGHTILPMKIFGYLASARPILAPSTADVREILDHEKNALLVPPGDTSGAAASLYRLISDRNLSDRLANGALETSRDLTWDARAKKIESFALRRLGHVVLSDGTENVANAA